MPYRAAAWIAALLAGCAILIGMAHALARQQDPLPRVAALLPDPGCAAPCWQGLRPGYTGEETLLSWFSNPPDGWRVGATVPNMPANGWQVQLPGGAYFDVGWMRSRGAAVDRLVLSDLPNVHVGHLIAALGESPYVEFFWRDSRLSMRMFYPQYRLTVLVERAPSRLRPDLPVDSVLFDAIPWSRPALALDWRGFGPITRYFLE